MIDFETTQRLIRVQERVGRSTFHELRKDGHHKSSEGAVSITFSLPSVFEPNGKPTWTVEVYSYVLGPERNHSFHGSTAAEAVSKAEDAVAEWCFGSEMEMFEGACPVCAGRDE